METRATTISRSLPPISATPPAAPSAANNYNGAAIINNPYILGAGNSATIDTFSTQFGAVANSLNLGNGSALTIVNGSTGSFGTGFFGIAGSTTLGSGVVVDPGNTASSGAGVLDLIGAVTDSGNGLIKTGSGTLVLSANNTSTFMGTLTVNSGFLQITNANALPSGGTIINNSQKNTTSAPTGPSGGFSITLGGTDTATTLGLAVGQEVFGTGVPIGTYITSASGTSVTLSQALTAGAAGTYNFSASGSCSI